MDRQIAIDRSKLPAPLKHPCLDGPLAPLVLRPWFDRLAVRCIGRWVLPHQRAIAAALISNGSPARFSASTGIELARSEKLEAALRQRAGLALNLEAADQIWDSAFFAGRPPQPRNLVRAEVERRRAAQNAISGGADFLRLCKSLRAPREPMKDPHQALADAKVLSQRDGADFPAPDDLAIEKSHPVASSYGSEYWLRFHSPLLGDRAWAHVYEPPDRPDPPTLIFLHGIAMELEYWADLTDPINALTRSGIRVIRPEGPWHGRRRLPGYFGGEPALADGLPGFFKLFRAWSAELGCLIRWSRQQSAGPVAIGGVSLGALTCQRMACAAADWPAEQRPDALFLVATSGALRETLEGSLGRALDLPGQLATAGWQPDDLATWTPLLEPTGPPCLPPDQIIMLLGEKDDLTPLPGGLDLARTWQIPQENLFLRPNGHFTVALRLGLEPAPLERLLALLMPN